MWRAGDAPVLRANLSSADRSVTAMGGAIITGLGAGRRNDWATPPEIFNALGCRFDLDVAAPLNGPLRVPTSRWFSSHALEHEWDGFVWMNPPFGGRNGIRPWLDKFLAHGNGIALTPDRVSAPWFQEAWNRPDAILFTPKTPFLLPDGAKAGNPAFGNALWACGERAVAAVLRSEARGFGKVHRPHNPIAAGSLAVGSDLYRADGGKVAGEAADRQVTHITDHGSHSMNGEGL